MLWLFGIFFSYQGEILAGLLVNVGYQIWVLGCLPFTQNRLGENLVHKHRKYKLDVVWVWPATRYTYLLQRTSRVWVGSRPRAKPLPSFSQGTTSYFPVQHKRSSYSMKLKERQNQTNCHLLARDNRSYFFYLPNDGSSLRRLCHVLPGHSDASIAISKEE